MPDRADLKPVRINAGAYQIRAYRINRVRPGYWDIWIGDEQVQIEGWIGWPSLSEASRALTRFFETAVPDHNREDQE